jgi:hypothetical protein
MLKREGSSVLEGKTLRGEYHEAWPELLFLPNVTQERRCCRWVEGKSWCTAYITRSFLAEIIEKILDHDGPDGKPRP